MAVGKQDRLASLSCRVKAHQRVHQYWDPPRVPPKEQKGQCDHQSIPLSGLGRAYRLVGSLRCKVLGGLPFSPGCRQALVGPSPLAVA